MPEYLFADRDHPCLPQIGEITSSTLDPIEKVLVEELVNWRIPEGFKDAIHFVHGRSIVFQSPSRVITDSNEALKGNFNGLQLIGAGGDRTGFKQTTRLKSDAIYIDPVNPVNHGEVLKSILQLRRIDDKGKLHLWDRPYAPLHGMDSGEAEKRKAYSNLLNQQVNHFHKAGRPTLFVFPKFAADGIFPDKFDPQGQPLRFQVYRVPLLDRFPGQHLGLSKDHGFDVALLVLHQFSFLVGRLFRNFHSLDLAYMDGHIGNMSMMLPPGRRLGTVFATDLGSIADISKEPFSTRYHGIDTFTFFMSTRQYLEIYFKWLAQNAKSMKPEDIRAMSSDFIYNASSGFIEGYFKPELTANKSAKLSDEEITGLVTTQATKLVRGYFRFAHNTDDFLDFFEKFSESTKSLFDHCPIPTAI